MTISTKLMNKNMIDRQLKPMGINNKLILEAFKSIPRELFVNKASELISYHEGNIEIKENRWLLSAVLIARLINCVPISNEDVILEIGSCTGYTTAILEKLSSLVVGVEIDAELRNNANNILSKIGADSAVIIEGEHILGNTKSAPYDKIFIFGSVHSIPVTLFDQLADNGQIICGIKNHNNSKAYGKAVVFKKNKDIINSSTIFDVNIPTMLGFDNKSIFEF